MNKIEYSDFYKFLASLGLVIVSFALFLPWLFLRESFDSLVSKSDLANLTSNAQLLIQYRQVTALWFIQNIIWFSSALTFFGILFLGSGTYLWYRKQKLQDTKEQLETEKLRLEVKNMTPEQIAEKVLKEAESDIFLERQDEQIANESSPKVYAHNYFRIENILISKLITCFGIENVLANQRARNQEFDVVVTHGRRMDDYIFEIKYITNPSGLERRLREVKNKLTLGIQTYTEVTSRYATGIGLFVFSGNYPEKLPTEYFSRIIDELTITDETSIKLLMITEAELARLRCDDLDPLFLGIFRSGVIKA